MDSTDGYLAFGTIRLARISQDGSNDQWRMVGSDANDREHAHPCPALCLGEQRQWLKTQRLPHTSDNHASLRVYALPEDVSRSSRGSVKDFRKVLKFLADFIDTTSDAWDGRHDPRTPIRTYREPMSSQEESLFYIFNTLQSPDPSIDNAGSCVDSQQSMADIFRDSIHGLKTTLYPYQKRSVAAMLRKEANPAKSIDPRKPRFQDLNGTEFYFDIHEGALLLNPYLYSEPRGGILAETMGYGKTLICIALILATRGHYPKVPEGRLNILDKQVNERTPSLLELAAKTIKQAGIPWKSEFAHLEKAGYHFEHCTETLDKYEAKFAEPIFHPMTPNRLGKKREDCRILRLCYATLLIVPPNLLVQWQHEMEKHTEQDALDILVLDSSTKEIPDYKTLMRYDVVLITKARFEQEYRDDDFNQGRRLGQERFRSQLTELRWLRVICDEGHGFAGSSYRTNAMAMLDKMSIERRWVVSGTPSHSLHGVEVSLALNESQHDMGESRTGSIQTALERRKIKDTTREEVKDMERLRVMVVKFLKLQPWANQKGSDYADWKKYLAPFDAERKRRFAPALRVILQSLIVRHRIEDIDKDLYLPPLYNTTVYLEPSYYDKLSMNLFRLVLTSNAVTSERIDEDYMFHPKNRKFLNDLINNLRHSSFHWVGFTEHDVTETLRVSNTYLDNNIDRISDEDGALLTEAIMNGQRALNDPGWRAFSFFHEIGVYIQDFPEHAAQAWALHGEDSTPLLLGTVQAREAQQFVLKRVDTDDPGAGLTGAGLRAMLAARERATEEQKTRNKTLSNNNGKSPTVGAVEEPKVKNQSTSSSSLSSPPTIRPPTKSATALNSLPSTPKRSLRTSNATLPPSLMKTRILGFTSAKLNYLCSRILSLHTSERIIIFYDSNNIAFWIAEALELLSIKFLIYTNTLSVNRRAAYLATFNNAHTFRVLLMDLKQASHGLHVASASRVFIVSPIWQPSVESQAIKRAHRIGQTRPVYVETLVLRGTLEEKILKRRKQMSNAEHVKAEKSLLDDGTMNGIIRGEGFLKIAEGEEKALNHGRKLLDVPVPLFERRDQGPGRGGGDAESEESDLILGLEDEDKHAAKKRKKDNNGGKGRAKAVAFAENEAVMIPSPFTSSIPPISTLDTEEKGQEPENPTPGSKSKPKKSVRITAEVPGSELTILD
ncbi:uncharacterized protein Z518_04309 [Rhinocladiella mackenziei CBS 650.93]|uniref:Helicase C-terminal domain-containing protein n=1 Tax=Rhinocladiella mackenziei CBS 650.93 TaxID=1442369 RepID=A0A0D2H7F3_9EURO|nr:uncharacterized protein Z518_04309 [Rhinocladiella mackenziei CBS 650.93]KIX06333.1 hypothetical protein Z518_04309 [Rhinocladiella mackenziei CBS 650.93]